MRRTVSGAIMCAAIVIACEDDATQAVLVGPQRSPYLFVGDTVSLTAQAFCCSDGRDDPYKTKESSDRRPGDFKWYSSNKAVATVDDRGFVRAVATGKVRINATYDGYTGYHDFVITRTIVDVRLEPASKTIRIGDTVTFRITLLAADQTSVDSVPALVETFNLGVARRDPPLFLDVPSPGDAKFIGTAAGSVAISVNNEHRIPNRRVIRDFNLTVVP